MSIASKITKWRNRNKPAEDPNAPLAGYALIGMVYNHLTMFDNPNLHAAVVFDNPEEERDRVFNSPVPSLLLHRFGDGHREHSSFLEYPEAHIVDFAGETWVLAHSLYSGVYSGIINDIIAKRGHRIKELDNAELAECLRYVITGQGILMKEGGWQRKEIFHLDTLGNSLILGRGNGELSFPRESWIGSKLEARIGERLAGLAVEVSETDSRYLLAPAMKHAVRKAKTYRREAFDLIVDGIEELLGGGYRV